MLALHRANSAAARMHAMVAFMVLGVRGLSGGRGTLVWTIAFPCSFADRLSRASYGIPC